MTRIHINYNKDGDPVGFGRGSQPSDEEVQKSEEMVACVCAYDVPESVWELLSLLGGQKKRLQTQCASLVAELHGLELPAGVVSTWSAGSCDGLTVSGAGLPHESFFHNS
jgi:hypothetical protein